MSEKYCEHCDTDHTCREDIIECYGGQIDKLEHQLRVEVSKAHHVGRLQAYEYMEKWLNKEGFFSSHYNIFIVNRRLAVDYLTELKSRAGEPTK